MRTFRFSYLLLMLLVITPVAAWSHPADNEASPRQSMTTADSRHTEGPHEILINALSLKGTRYRYGGSSPDTGFDCSGFVRYVFSKAANISLPHNARAISQFGDIISRQQLQPGDLVFYNTMKSAFSHVGIYLGNNRFIHAPSSGGGIRIVNMDETYWANRFDGARRILRPD